MKIFKYLHKKKSVYSNKSVFDLNYKPEEQLKKFIIQNQKNMKYYVFDTIKQGLDYIESLNNKDKNFIEIIFGNKKQKLKFDIDISNNNLDYFNNNFTNESFEKFMINKIILTFNKLYVNKGIKLLTKNDIIICSSHSNNKISYHFIINNYFVNNNLESKYFKDQLKIIINNNSINKFIDDSVYKSTQGFRIINNTKPNQNRFKVLLNENEVQDINTIIQYINNCCELPNLNENVNKSCKQIITDIDVKKALDISKNYIKGFDFREVHNNSGLLLFDRIKSTYCQICKRVHENDNSLVIQIIKPSVIMYCFRDDLKTGIKIGEYEITEEEREIAKEKYKINKLKKILDDVNVNRDENLFDKLPKLQKNVYCNDKMKSFAKHPLLCIRAQMKMGKTKELKKYIENNFKDTASYTNNIVIISFRQTFTNEIKNKFNNFNSYLDIKGDIDLNKYNKLIIQTESLHRISMGPNCKKPDLVILDESESIFEQFTSGNFQQFSESFAIFSWLLKYSEHIICMDANLSNRTYNILKSVRNTPIHYHENTFSRAQNDKYYFAHNEHMIYNKIFNVLKNNKKIVYITNSIKKSDIIHDMLKDDFPDKKILVYNSKTPVSIKNKHFSDVNKYWSKCDILIYTPTVSAGISFELQHFDYGFGYFTNMSCNVEVCRQMLARVRTLDTFYLYLEGCYNNYPEKAEDIEEILRIGQKNILSDINSDFLPVKYNANGFKEIEKTPYYYLWLENKIINNKSKNKFIKRFINQIAQTGAQVLEMDLENNGDNITNLKDKYKLCKDKLENKLYNNIANASLIDEEEKENIEKELQDGKNDIDEQKIIELKKYNLCNLYNWYEENLSPEFVKLYSKKNIKYNYRNLRMITRYDTIIESLKEIKRQESERLKFTSNGSDCDIIYLNSNFKYEKHRVCNQLLRLLGYEDITDKTPILKKDIEKNIEKNKMQIEKAIKYSCNILDISKPSYKYISNNMILKYINKILKNYYGIYLSNKKNDDYRKIIWPYYFTYNNMTNDKPNINIKSWLAPKKNIEDQIKNNEEIENVKNVKNKYADIDELLE